MDDPDRRDAFEGEGFIGRRGQAAVLERTEGADELAVFVIATPDQTGGEREEQGVVQEKLAPAVHGPAMLADHKVLDAGLLALAHILEDGRLVLELGQDFLGGGLGKR